MARQMRRRPSDPSCHSGETLHEATVVVAAASTHAGARKIIARAAGPDEASRLSVLCAARLEDGTSGFDLVEFASRTHPDVRVILLTDGEREELLQWVLRGVAAIVSKPVSLDSLRNILARVGRERPRTATSVQAEVRDIEAHRRVLEVEHVDAKPIVSRE